jgi:hypothetical protein
MKFLNDRYFSLTYLPFSPFETSRLFQEGDKGIKKPSGEGRPAKLLCCYIHNAANLSPQANCFLVRFVCFVFNMLAQK